MVLVVGSPEGLIDPPSEVLDASDEAGLLARIREALEPAPKADGRRASVLRFADYRLDLAGQSLCRQAGQEIVLTWGEYRLLREFVQRPGQLLSRDHLLQSLSGHGAETYDRSIDMQVVRLRRKIEPDPKRPSLIVAIRRSGYKFVAQVEEIEATVESTPKATDGSSEPTPAGAERRQITALSIELLPANGSSVATDPEELQKIIDAYRRRVSAVVSQYHGITGQCISCEILAYFGHPVAQEHAAEHAIHAALALSDGGLVGTGAEVLSDLSIRAGLATGLVVVNLAGEMIGDAPNDAARMRSLAEPGQVVVAASTRQLGGPLFTHQAVGPESLRGIPGSTFAWRVLGPSAAASRSEALYGGAVTPLVGREEERDVLLRAWQRAKTGEGRVVLLSGEPGIGKSRLLVELEAWLAAQPHAQLRYFCSPLYQDSGLHPIIARWEQECGFARGDSAERRRCKLEAAVAQDAFSPTEVALLAGMLGVPTDERSPA